MKSKAEIIRAVADRSGASIALSTKVIDSLIDEIESSIKSGEGVKIAGFVSLELVKKKAREGRNPKTGETIQIPEKTTVKAKLVKRITDAAEHAVIE